MPFRIHDVVIVGLPLPAILAGILFARTDSKDVRAEMRAEISGLRAEMITRCNKIEDNLGRIDAD